MSQPLSAVIDNLSTDVPLTSLSSWTSQKVQTLEYSSLSISFNSNVTHSIYFLFSDDGINFDISSSFIFTPLQSYAGGDNYVSPCLAQWVKIQLVNTSLYTSTFCRLYTYGSINNLASKATIQGSVNVNGANLAITEPTTPLGSIAVANYTIAPYSSINFNKLPNQSITTMSTTPPTPLLANLVNYQVTDTTKSRYGIIDGVLTLYNLTDSSQLGWVSRFYNKHYTPYLTGNNYVIQFSSLFLYPYTDGSFKTISRAGFGTFNFATGASQWTSGYSLKIDDPLLVNGTYYPFCIEYFDNTGKVTVYQPYFNIDTLDGSRSTQNPSGMHLLINYLNTYRIILNNSCGDQVLFQVYDSAISKFITFHKISYTNSLICHQEPYGGCFIMDVTKTDSSIIANNDGVGVSNVVVYQTNVYDLAAPQLLSFQQSSSVTTSLSGEFSLYNNITFNGYGNTLVVKVNEIIITNLSNSAFLIATLYKNNTYSPALTYTNLDVVRSPLQYNIGASIPSSYGNKIKTYTVSPNTTSTIAIEDIYLSPNEELTMVWILSSGGSSVNCSATLNMIQIG